MPLLDYCARERSALVFPKLSHLFPFFSLMVKVAHALKMFQWKKNDVKINTLQLLEVRCTEVKDGSLATPISYTLIVRITGIGLATSSGTGAGPPAWDYQKKLAGP